MSEARELLKEALFFRGNDMPLGLIEKIQTELAKPESEPKPLTEQEILDCSERTWHKFNLDDDVNFKGLVNITRAIEEAHGIRS